MSYHTGMTTEFQSSILSRKKEKRSCRFSAVGQMKLICYYSGC
ncbi:hypothetical protein pipiens_000387, partial [Culex pipiens pipiens]